MTQQCPVKELVFTAWNDEHLNGVTLTQRVTAISLADSTIYVSNNGSDANSGTSWAEAKATINAGVSAQQIIGGQVLVTNGTYGAVGSYDNSLNVPIRLTSVNGPAHTTIQGDGTNSCLTIGDVKAIVSGFTIRGGKANKGGGGGISEGDAYNCTIIYNVCGTASRGGGVQGKSDKYATIYNCIIYGNTTAGSSENIRYVTAYNSCSPDFAPGINPNITSVKGNIASAPAFANPAIGDYSLLITSPCINAGDNAFVSPDHNQDYDSQSRISGKMAD